MNTIDILIKELDERIAVLRSYRYAVGTPVSIRLSNREGASVVAGVITHVSEDGDYLHVQSDGFPEEAQFWCDKPLRSFSRRKSGRYVQTSYADSTSYCRLVV